MKLKSNQPQPGEFKPIDGFDLSQFKKNFALDVHNIFYQNMVF